MSKINIYFGFGLLVLLIVLIIESNLGESYPILNFIQHYGFWIWNGILLLNFFRTNRHLKLNKDSHVEIANLFNNHKNGIENLQKLVKDLFKKDKDNKKEIKIINKKIIELSKDLDSLEQEFLKNDKQLTKARRMLKKKKEQTATNHLKWLGEQQKRKTILKEKREKRKEERKNVLNENKNKKE